MPWLCPMESKGKAPCTQVWEHLQNMLVHRKASLHFKYTSIQKTFIFSMKTLNLTTLAANFLMAIVWVSSGLFALKILIFYGGDAFSGNLSGWNEGLPDLYDEHNLFSTSGMGLHFLGGALILILGSIQFVEAIRHRYLHVHRWIGRVYVAACMLTAAGGLLFIFVKGTIGGAVMNIGFSGYGIAMLVCAVFTLQYARSQQMDKHRAWAIRLYALAIGSWLYRMQYGFVFMLGLGWPQQDFRGTFDYLMAFFFWVPNLLVAEFFIRASIQQFPKWVQVSGILLVFGATFFIGLATYFSNYRFVLWLFGFA